MELDGISNHVVEYKEKWIIVCNRDRNSKWVNAFRDECKANEEYKKLLKMANRPAEICLDGSIHGEAK